MSLHTKLILPLIDENLTLEDISPKTGFVDIYTFDINRPSLTNYVFLMYKVDPTEEFIRVKNKLTALKTFYSKKHVKINNVLYIIYTFIINTSIKYIRKNAPSMLNKDDKVKIGKFWKYTDVDVTDFLLGYNYIGNKFEDVVIPEEDYSPSDFITYDEKRGTLVISASL